MVEMSRRRYFVATLLVPRLEHNRNCARGRMTRERRGGTFLWAGRENKKYPRQKGEGEGLLRGGIVCLMRLLLLRYRCCYEAGDVSLLRYRQSDLCACCGDAASLRYRQSDLCDCFFTLPLLLRGNVIRYVAEQNAEARRFFGSA